MAKLDEMEKVLADAQFSINVINLFSPPKDFNYGKINSRALVDREATNLRKAMTEQGMKPFSIENMIPIVIARRHVDPTCITSGMNAYNAPDLKLSVEGMKELRELELAGGRHRVAAMKQLHDIKMTEVTEVHKKMITMENKKLDEQFDQRKKDMTVQAYRNLEAKKEKEVDELGRWGVVLYDKGK